MSANDWWRGAVIYQIYPRSFQDDDGDGLGDLRGITRRLGHVADLGVDAIWLSPFFPSPMADMGYDIADHCGVDPAFGTIEDFDALVAEAHRLGLKVTIDQVYPHTSDAHRWFDESRADTANPKADWYVWADPKPDGSMPNNWQSVFGGPAWAWEPARRQYYMHNFLPSQPQMNLHNPEVQEALLETTRFWLERGVDGFRMDSVNYQFHDAKLTDNPPIGDGKPEMGPENTYGYQAHLYDKSRPENLVFLKRFRSMLDRYGAVAVGEVGDGARSLETMAAYTTGKRLHMAYSFELLGPTFTAAHFRKAMGAFDAVAGGEGWPAWAFSNHDVPRHLTRWAEHSDDPDRLAKLCAMLLLSFKGSICLYQGEELGLPEAALDYAELTDPVGLKFWPENKGRDGARTPMPWAAAAQHAGFSGAGETWLPVKAPHAEMAVDTQDGVPGSVLEFYREMLAFRKGAPALRSGGIAFVDAGGDVLGFWRGAGADRRLCLFNLGATDQSVSMEETLALVGPRVGEVALDGGGVTLGALSGGILEVA
ncbi:MAG: alpha-amylase family glycosyl hydrolase [Paracoccaceae bacterium]|nr:alpha-amylase family glycosyl hydrolase [Paracoccaceae bacterium]